MLDDNERKQIESFGAAAVVGRRAARPESRAQSDAGRLDTARATETTVLVFAGSVAHAQVLAAMLQYEEVPAAAVSGQHRRNGAPLLHRGVPRRSTARPDQLCRADRGLRRSGGRGGLRRSADIQPQPLSTDDRSRSARAEERRQGVLRHRQRAETTSTYTATGWRSPTSSICGNVDSKALDAAVLAVLRRSPRSAQSPRDRRGLKPREGSPADHSKADQSMPSTSGLKERVRVDEEYRWSPRRRGANEPSETFAGVSDRPLTEAQADIVERGPDERLLVTAAGRDWQNARGAQPTRPPRRDRGAARRETSCSC